MGNTQRPTAFLVAGVDSSCPLISCGIYNFVRSCARRQIKRVGDIAQGFGVFCRADLGLILVNHGMEKAAWIAAHG